MQVSDEFFRFCSSLHQDVVTIYGPEIQDIINGALELVQNERLATLRAYLNELVTGPYSDAELQELFRSTHTEIRIWDDRGVRQFLTMVRDSIDAKVLA